MYYFESRNGYNWGYDGIKVKLTNKYSKNIGLYAEKEQKIDDLLLK